MGSLCESLMKFGMGMEGNRIFYISNLLPRGVGSGWGVGMAIHMGPMWGRAKQSFSYFVSGRFSVVLFHIHIWLVPLMEGIHSVVILVSSCCLWGNVM